MSDNTIALRQAGVDLGGLMTVLSRHLYSTPTVALRELVQNAHDSIVRRRIEQPDWNDKSEDGKRLSRIDIIPDIKNHQLRIIDTGAGLTETEIHKYLATVGVGYTRQLRQNPDFHKNQGINNASSNPTQTLDNKDVAAATDNTGLIGMFGLGFLSAFVLANKVTVSTTSYQSPNIGCRYLSSDAENYAVTYIEPRSIGTEVLLDLKEDYYQLLQPEYLRKVLSHYCALLIEPIYISEAIKDIDDLSRFDSIKSVAINPEPPPWRHTYDTPLHPSTLRKQALAFASRFEKHFEPICTLPIKPQADSDAVGMLWIQDGATYGTSDNRNLSVFLRGMLLDDDARDLLPSWAGFVGGVIESQNLTPTASREDLQRDQQFDNTRHALNEALINGLSQLATEQPETWRRVLRRHNEALLGAALCDERLFLLLMDSLHVPTSHGDLLVKQLISKGTIHVVLESDAGFEDMLFRALGIPVAQGSRYAVVPFLRRWVDIKGYRLIELGTRSGNKQLFQVKILTPEKQRWLQQHLCHNEKLIASQFAPASLPLIVVSDREQALKKRLAEDDKDKKISQAALRLARHFTDKIEDDQPARLYLNVDNPAVKLLLTKLDDDTPSLNHHSLTAVSLLRSFKTLLTSSTDPEYSTQQLQQALSDFGTAIQYLLEDTPSQ